MEPNINESGYRRLASSGQFVEAVRLYRRQHGGSLEEAWDAVERMATPPAADAVGLPLQDPVVTVEIDALLRAGKKIEAIKRLRDETQMGLKEAKDAIDRRAAHLGLSSRAPGTQPVTRSGCFIATAAYGSPHSPEVVALRRFRDRVLRRTRPGRILVRHYYQLSPPLAACLGRSQVARAMVRCLLTLVAACCTAGLRSRQRQAAGQETGSDGAT